MTINEPMKAIIAERLDAARRAAEAHDTEATVHGLLDVFAAIGRDVAQRAWLQHHDADQREEALEDVASDMVFECLKVPLSHIYPELPVQVEGVLRDAFDDESFKLEDPLGWAEMNADGGAQ